MPQYKVLNKHLKQAKYLLCSSSSTHMSEVVDSSVMQCLCEHSVVHADTKAAISVQHNKFARAANRQL